MIHFVTVVLPVICTMWPNKEWLGLPLTLNTLIVNSQYNVLSGSLSDEQHDVAWHEFFLIFYGNMMVQHQ